ncbi:MAG: carboxypeptidase-like regulatory domain-containing protein, partial [Planctomycetota bacterium]
EAVRPFTFADGEQQVWNVTKDPDRSIRGIVVDADGEPLAGWSVRLMPSAMVRRMNQPFTETDGSGKFEFGGLEDEAQRLFVFAPVPARDRNGAAGMVPRAVLDSVRPSPTEHTVRIDAASMGSGWIEGSIEMPDGVQAKAVLSLYAKVLRGGGFSVPQERLAPDQTTFRIGPLPAGEYDLLCDIEGRGRLAHNALRLGTNETLRLPPFAANAQRPLQLVLRHADGRLATGATVKLQQTHDPCRETEPGHYESQPIAAGAYDALVRGPDFALCTVLVAFAPPWRAFEHTVPAGTAVQLRVVPAVARERWIGALTIELHDANGTQLVRDMLQIDGKQDFVVPIGLAPGTYTVKCSAFGDGKGMVTFEVGALPLRLDLQLAK